MPNIHTLLMIAISALVLGGCGQMGPLYMPTEEAATGPATGGAEQSAPTASK